MKIVALRTGKLSVGDYNARRDVGDITDLKASIELEGLLQPVVVRPIKGKYEVVVGSRRLAAAKAAG
ncbi:MAG: ParB/RepB/Spo0J family partition protein, partial [Nitrososphaeria archaeon]